MSATLGVLPTFIMSTFNISAHTSAYARLRELRHPYGDLRSLPYRPSIFRDLRCGVRDLLAFFKYDGHSWFEKLVQRATISLTAPFLLSLGAFWYAYWAEWEKLAWDWKRTTAVDECARLGESSPPSWHRLAAMAVGLFWGLLAFVAVFFPLYVLPRFMVSR